MYNHWLCGLPDKRTGNSAMKFGTWFSECLRGGEQMKVHRVVTGHTHDGAATIIRDSEVEGITTPLVPGMELHRLWAGDDAPSVPYEGDVSVVGSYFPQVGGFRFGLYTVPPESAMELSDSELRKAFQDFERDLPGLLSHMEPENPGMHTTDTVDFEYVLSGEVWLELDNGEEVHLKPGDTVVQNGTRHAWRNKSTKPCQMVVFAVGAHRRE